MDPPFVQILAHRHSDHSVLACAPSPCGHFTAISYSNGLFLVIAGGQKLHEAISSDIITDFSWHPTQETNPDRWVLIGACIAGGVVVWTPTAPARKRVIQGSQ